MSRPDPWGWLSDAPEEVRARGPVCRLDPGEDVVQAGVAAALRYGAGSTGSGSSRAPRCTWRSRARSRSAPGPRPRSCSGPTTWQPRGADRPGRSRRPGRVRHREPRLSRRRLPPVAQPGAHHPAPRRVAVDAALAAQPGRALVVTDAVFSVDGSLASLAELHGVVRRHGALLLVDKAHALGVLGPGGAGACAALGLHREPDVVRTVTLSKSLGSQGGAVLGKALLSDHLVDTARAFVFDTGLAPASAASALAARHLVDEARLDALARVGTRLAAALGVPATPGAVLQVSVGDPHRALAAQAPAASRGCAWAASAPSQSPPATPACA